MKSTLTSLLFLICLSAFSQTLLESATEKFNNQKWAEASKDFTKYLKKENQDSSAWFGLGVCQRNLGEYLPALESFKKAKSTNFNPFIVDYNIAKVHALTSATEAMYDLLDSLANNGFFAFSQLSQDTEFDKYRDSDRFNQILKKVELNAYPCLSSEDARHFDFWIGEWDVYVNGQVVGLNKITRAKGGCAIHENYTTSRNYAGQSINFYSPVDEKWHQHWVGSSGDVYNYVETKREEGLLQFVSEFKNPGNGNISLSRLTFTLNDDGTVRQLFESSTDDGKTWTPAFDGLYKRRD
ncbi:MAG: hypothetical protein Tsb0034_03910 [Ekhidna sp.]